MILLTLNAAFLLFTFTRTKMDIENNSKVIIQNNFTGYYLGIETNGWNPDGGDTYAIWTNNNSDPHQFIMIQPIANANQFATDMFCLFHLRSEDSKMYALSHLFKQELGVNVLKVAREDKCYQLPQMFKFFNGKLMVRNDSYLYQNTSLQGNNLVYECTDSSCQQTISNPIAVECNKCDECVFGVCKNCKEGYKLPSCKFCVEEYYPKRDTCQRCPTQCPNSCDENCSICSAYMQFKSANCKCPSIPWFNQSVTKVNQSFTDVCKLLKNSNTSGSILSSSQVNDNSPNSSLPIFGSQLYNEISESNTNTLSTFSTSNILPNTSIINESNKSVSEILSQVPQYTINQSSETQEKVNNIKTPPVNGPIQNSQKQITASKCINEQNATLCLYRLYSQRNSIVQGINKTYEAIIHAEYRRTSIQLAHIFGFFNLFTNTPQYFTAILLVNSMKTPKVFHLCRIMSLIVLPNELPPFPYNSTPYGASFKIFFTVDINKDAHQIENIELFQFNGVSPLQQYTLWALHLVTLTTILLYVLLHCCKKAESFQRCLVAFYYLIFEGWTLIFFITLALNTIHGEMMIEEQGSKIAISYSLLFVQISVFFFILISQHIKLEKEVKNRSTLSDHEQNRLTQQYPYFLSGLNCSTRAQRIYREMSYIKKITYSVVLVTFVDNSLITPICFIFVNILMLIYLVAVRPFKRIVFTVIAVAFETTMILILCFILVDRQNYINVNETSPINRELHFEQFIDQGETTFAMAIVLYAIDILKFLITIIVKIIDKSREAKNKKSNQVKLTKQGVGVTIRSPYDLNYDQLIIQQPEDQYLK